MRGDIRTGINPGTIPENAPPPEREPHPLKRKWMMALAVLGVAIWGFFGAFSVMPVWAWATILGILVVIAFAIALFGPRSTRRA